MFLKHVKFVCLSRVTCNPVNWTNDPDDRTIYLHG